LPGSEALLKSGIGKGNRRCEYCFYFCLLFLFYFAMESSPFGFLFGNSAATVASIYSESLIKTTCQYLLLLVGFDTLIYQKYYDTPPILVGQIIVE
jgi:hypothetical protein